MGKGQGRGFSCRVRTIEISRDKGRLRLERKMLKLIEMG